MVQKNSVLQKASSALTPDQFLDHTLMRLLRHHALNVSRAERHLHRIIEWRASSKIAEVLPEVRCAPGCGLPVVEIAVSPDSDANTAGGGGNSLLCFSAGDQYLKSSLVREVQIPAIDKMFDYVAFDPCGPQAQRCTIVVDFHGFSTKNIDMNGMRIGIAAYLNYFPDVLTRVLLVNYPTIVYGVWRLVKPLLDARTVSHIVFVPSIRELHCHLDASFPKHIRPTWLGGTAQAKPVTLYNGSVLQPDELAMRFKLDSTATNEPSEGAEASQ